MGTEQTEIVEVTFDGKELDYNTYQSRIETLKGIVSVKTSGFAGKASDLRYQIQWMREALDKFENKLDIIEGDKPDGNEQ